MRTRKKWIRIASFLMAFIMFFMPSIDVFAMNIGAHAYSSSAPGRSYRYLGQRLYLVEYKTSAGDKGIGVRDWLTSSDKQKVIAINRHYMEKKIGDSEGTYNDHIDKANRNFGKGVYTYTQAYTKIKTAFGEKALKKMKDGIAKGYHYAVVLEGWGAYAGKGKLKYTPAGAMFYYTFKGDKKSPWRSGGNSWYHLCHFKNKDVDDKYLSGNTYGLAPSLKGDFQLVTAVPKVPGGGGCNPRWVYDMLWDTMNTLYYDPLTGKPSNHHIRGYVVYTFKEKTTTTKAEVSLRVFDHDEAGNWNSQVRSYGECYQIKRGSSANYFAQAVTNAYTSMDNKKLTRNEAYHKGTERGVKTALMPEIDCKLGSAGVPSQPKTSNGYILMQADGTPLVSIGEALASAEEKKRDYRVWFKSTADAKVTTETTPLELQESIADDSSASSDTGTDDVDVESASEIADAEATEADTVDDDKGSPDDLNVQESEYIDDGDDADEKDANDKSVEQGTASETEITNTAFGKDKDAANDTDLEEEAEAEKENAAENSEGNLLTVYEIASGTSFGHKWVAQGIKSSNSESDTLYNSSNIWKLFQKNANSIDGASPCVEGKSRAGGSATLYQASLNSTSLELKRLSNDLTEGNYKKTSVKDGTYKIGTASKYRYMQDKVHYYVYTIVADTQKIDLQTSFTGDVTIKKKEYTGISVGFTNIKDVPAGSKVVAVSNVDTNKKDGERSLIEGTSDVKSHAKSVIEIYNWLQGLASKQYTVPNSGGKKANLGESRAIMQTSNGTLTAGCVDNFEGDYASGNVGYTFVVFKTNEVKTESGEGLQDYELNRYFPSAFSVEQYDALNNGLGSVFKTYQPSEPSVTWSHHGLDHKHNVHEHDHVHEIPDGHGGYISFIVHNHDSNPDDWVSAPVEFKYSGSTKAQDYDKKEGNKGQFIARYDHCDTAHGLMKYSGDYPYTTATGRVIDLTQTSPYQFDWGHMLARNMAGDIRTVSSLAYTSKEESGEGFKVGSELSEALQLEYGDTAAKPTSGASAERNSSAIASGGTWTYTFNFTAKHLHEGAYKPKVKRCFSYTTCSWCGAVVCNRGCDTGEVTVDFNLNDYYTLNGGAVAHWAPKLHMTVRKYLEKAQEIGVSPMKDGIQSRFESSGGSFKHSVDKLAQNKTASKSNEFGYVYYENYGDSSIGTKDITDKFVPEVLMRVEKATGDFTNAKATGIWTMGEKERNTKPIAFYLFKIKNDDSKAASGKTRGNTAATGNSANGNNRATYTTGSDISIKAKVKAKGYMYGYALDQISTNEEDKSKWTGTPYNTQIPSGKIPTWNNNNINTLKDDFTDWVKKVSDKKNYQADFVMSIKKSGGSPIRYNGFSASLGKFSKPVSDGDGVKYTNAYPLTFRFGELQTEGKAGAGYRAMIDQIKKDYGDTTGTECSEATAKRIFKDSGIEQAIFDSVQSAKASTNKSQNGAGHNTNLGAGHDRTGVTDDGKLGVIDNGKFLTKSRTLGTKDHWYDEAVRTFVVRRFTTDKPLDFGTVMATDKVDYDNADDSGNSTHDAWFNFNLYFNYNKGDNKIRGIKQLFCNKSDFYDRKGSVADNASKTKNVIINNTFVDGSEFNITSTTTNSMGW